MVGLIHMGLKLCQAPLSAFPIGPILVDFQHGYDYRELEFSILWTV